VSEHQKSGNRLEIESTVTDYLHQAHSLAYALISPKLRIEWATPNFHDLLLEPPPEVQGQLLPNLLWEFVGAEQSLNQVLKGKDPSYRLERVNRSFPDGSAGYFRFLVLPVDKSQPANGLLLIIEDTTQEGRLEQQLVQDRNELRLTQAALAKANVELEHLNRLKSLFLSIAAHDMRAPLTAIAGFVELLRPSSSNISPQKRAEFLSIISSQVVRLDRLISDFIELDRLEQGKLSIQPVNCDLIGIINQVAQTMQDSAVREGLKFALVLEADEVVVYADPARLEQILYNLLSNAIKYTPSGGQIHLRAWIEANLAVFQVNDTGSGMSPEELGELFTLYYRTKQAQKSKTSGTGLGLFIVKALIDAHNGHIQVASQPGVGTTFTVRIPLADTYASFPQE